MAFPILYILGAAVFFDIPANKIASILLSPLYYAACFWVVLAGYGLWEMRRWGWYVFLFSNLWIGYESIYLVVNYSESHHKVLALAFSLLILIGIVLRVSREVRVPYFFPKIRWWESDPRYRLSVPAQMERQDGEAMKGEILDLSMGGCFVKLRNDLTQEEAISIAFDLFEMTVKIAGIVVWRSQSTVTHPKGVGIKFSPMDRQQRRVLKSMTQQLKKLDFFSPINPIKEKEHS